MAIHFDTQGPAPDGFHVPLTTEWQGLKTMMDLLQLTTGDNWRINLHMPFAGHRDYDDAAPTNQGSSGYYWSSSPYGSDNPDYVRAFYLNSSSVLASYYAMVRTFGFSVRCFKNEPVIPTSSWTTLYQGMLADSGVYWNSTDGLISISGNGFDWITIQDKNLGATTVYNDGDVLSEANCGNFYQWGNNYGFPYGGTVTTSSTQVDASNYGPGNYYSSDTFITWVAVWSSVQNDNLRGGVTQGTWETPDPIRLHGHIGTWHMESVKDYSAMQGPAPDGFHVPLSSEWAAVKTVWTNLGGGSSDGTNFGIALKLPFAGRRARLTSDVSSQRSDGYYWSSTRSSGNNAYYLSFNSSDIDPQSSNYRSNAFSVRCFKNSFVIPTSSWTKLYGTSIESGGIFWNSTDGLISLSSNGSTWITIADKNLGATTVWNSGDTLSEANCGYYYQRGNNYGFPFTGTVTTSSTKVDASNYGPGNYYSSSTFITVSSSPYRWDTTDNGNLRGGVTGVVTRYIPRS